MVKYLSITDFSTFRGVEPSDTTSPNEDQINKFIAIAEKDFDGSMGDYSLQAGVDIVSKGRAHGVTLEEPISAINSISMSNGDIYNPTWNSPMSTTDYVQKGVSRILIRGSIVGREYKVNADVGYAIGDVPVDVKYLVYLLTMKRAFNAHLFDNNVSDNVTRIIDVDVYKEISNGGNAFEGLGAMDVVINEQKAAIKGKLKSRLG